MFIKNVLLFFLFHYFLPFVDQEASAIHASLFFLKHSGSETIYIPAVNQNKGKRVCAVECGEMAMSTEAELTSQSYKRSVFTENNLARGEPPQHINDMDERILDATLQVEGEAFLVNRKHLALISPYFRALFFGCGIETTKKRVCLKGVNLQHFRDLMDYSRTGKLTLNRGNVLGILETADFLQMDQARLLCCKFLERELHISNCLGMMAYSSQLGCTQLYAAARQVVLAHFPAVMTDEDFLSLSKETMADLLSSDDLAIPKDDLALEAILRWVSFDPKREENLVELSELVRPELLSLSFITELLTRMKGSDPKARLICRLNEHFPTSWSMVRSVKMIRARETLYVLGGPHDQEQQLLYQFHPLSGRWQSCAPLQRKNLTEYSVAALGNTYIMMPSQDLHVLFYVVFLQQLFETLRGPSDI